MNFELQNMITSYKIIYFVVVAYKNKEQYKFVDEICM